MSSPDITPTTSTSYAAQRWARALAVIIYHTADTRTIPEWARLVGASRSTIDAWCRATHAPTRASLELGRLIRALHVTEGVIEDLQHVLDVKEPRTIRRMLLRSGLGPHLDERRRREIIDLLALQQLVTDRRAVRTLSSLLMERRGEHSPMPKSTLSSWPVSLRVTSRVGE